METKKPTKFWMVAGNGPPTKRHYHESVARAEAERLARQHPGETFALLESVAACVRVDTKWQETEADDDAPF